MKVVISGAGGFVGRALTSALSSSDMKVHPMYHTNESHGADAVQCDLVDGGRVKKVMEELSPDVFVHCAAMTNVDLCERQKLQCWDANVTATINCCRAAGKDVHFVHVSTSQVFDGKAGNYSEASLKNPMNWYGNTKSISEEIVRNLTNRWTVVRLSNQYGFDQKGKNFIHSAFFKLQKDEIVKAAGDKIASFTYLATTISALTEIVQRQLYGIYHVADLEPATKYDVLLRLASMIGKERLVIKEDAAKILEAVRPDNTSLDASKFAETFRQSKPILLGEGLARFVQEFKKHGN